MIKLHFIFKSLFLSTVLFQKASFEDFEEDQYDISDIVKVIEIKDDNDVWSNDGKPLKKLLGTAIQFKWILTTANAFVMNYDTLWDFPNEVVSCDNIRVLSLDGSYSIIQGESPTISKLVIHPNFKGNRLTEYNAALLYTNTYVTRTTVHYFMSPWNFNMMEPAYIMGLHESQVRKVNVRMDHGLHECPCFIRQQADSTICLFDIDRPANQCDFINGSPLFLKKGLSNGLLIGFTVAYYNLVDCVYTEFPFQEAMCVKSKVFFSAVTICSMFGFINITLGRNFNEDHHCGACQNLPLVLLILLFILLLLILQ